MQMVTLRESHHQCLSHVYSLGKMVLLRYKGCYYIWIKLSFHLSKISLQSDNLFTFNDSPINLFMGDFSSGMSTGTWRFNEY